MAPDVVVYPDSAHAPRPGLPHARIIVEVANTQSLDDLNTRCEKWIRQLFVRDVLGINLDAIRSHQGNVHSIDDGYVKDAPKCITNGTTRYAAPPGFTASTNPNLPRVSLKTWDFGTLLYGTTNVTACNNQALPAFQVTIPIEDVFLEPQ
ncbi:hypothetical protein RclHR1_15160005 [Rhizophagus clarus]|nr:hypothetical protein RclHR1_15160005 [Rhizophagus clarus]